MHEGHWVITIAHPEPMGSGELKRVTHTQMTDEWMAGNLKAI